MELNRRDALRALGLTGAAAAAGVTWSGTARAGDDHDDRDERGRDHDHGSRAEGTTLDRTLLLGTAGAGGYRRITRGPGEPHLVRDDLVGPAVARRRGRRPRGVLAFAHLTDIHVMDTQSPARVEFLDRYNDPDSPFAGVLPFESSYRPHEFLSAQVSEAMVATLNRIRRGPATGAPIAFSLATGDNTDNAQFNELRWHIDVLDGGATVRPDSGDTSRYEGVADLVAYDGRYWHPDGQPAGAQPDLPRATYGYPTVPGLLDAARRPFRATGLRTPWLTSFGNHDGLIQGNLPPNPVIAALATGPVKVTALPPGTDIIQLAQWLNTLDPRGLAVLLGGPTRLVTPDAARRFVTRAETIREHFRTSGSPRGHGYTARNLATGEAHYAFDRGVVRGISLDSVNPNGGASGSLDTAQFAWLERELIAGSSRYYDAAGNEVRQRRVRDRLFVLFSHHTIDTMDNLAGAPGTRVPGTAVRDLLLRFPNAILWVNGHTHVNSVTPYARANGSGGFWEVNTAAHIDWPIQSRLVEIADNRDGTLSVFGTIVDLAVPESNGGRIDSTTRLASLARELAGNDWQSRERPTPGVDGRRGAVEDRNVELLLPAPFDLRD